MQAPIKQNSKLILGLKYNVNGFQEYWINIMQLP